MKNVTPQMMAYLFSRRPFFQADLFTFDFADDTVPTLTLTTTDQDVSYDGVTWFGSSPQLGVSLNTRDPSYPSPVRSKWDLKNTIDVSTLELSLLSDGEDYRTGLNIKSLAHNGLFDGCTISLQRAIMPSFGDTSLGLIPLFNGPTGAVTISPINIKITVNGANVRMQQYMPKNRYMLSCIHHLYDPGCALLRSAFTFANTVGGGSTRSAITWGSGPPANSGNFSLGTIEFTSGAASGQTRTLQFANDTAGFMSYPLYQTPSPGDTFNITYGCDKTRDGGNGCAFFSNQQHYRGFRFVPPAEIGV